jgi:hypothetical protein
VRYIVRSGTHGFGEVKVLAESAAEALVAGDRMADQDLPDITVMDEAGATHSLAEFRNLHAVDGSTDAAA